MKTIDVRLSEQGINKAIELLTKYKDSIKPKAKEVCETLCDKAKPIVEEAYSARQLEDMSESHTFEVKVDKEVKEGAKLIAEGTQVAFWEFGAGLTAGEGYPDEYKGGVETYPGSWSQSELGKGQFDYVNHPYWEHKGVTFDHITPSMGMYEASKFIEENAEKELRKAFK